MKKYLFYMLLSLTLVSCIDSEKTKLKLFEGNEVLAVGLEHRFYVVPIEPETKVEGLPHMRVVEIEFDLQTDNPAITDLGSVPKDVSISQITVTPHTPATDEDINFDATEQAKVSIKHIWVNFSISTAATVTPLEGAPKLGTPGDYSVPRKYRVTSASGASKDWTITVKDFVP